MANRQPDLHAYEANTLIVNTVPGNTFVADEITTHDGTTFSIPRNTNINVVMFVAPNGHVIYALSEYDMYGKETVTFDAVTAMAVMEELGYKVGGEFA